MAGPYAGRLKCGDRRACGSISALHSAKEAGRFFDAPFEGTEDAVAAILRRAEIDPACTNVLMEHMFATARGERAETSDSEINPVGGLSQVDAALFAPFSYVALGHLHAPQRVGRAEVAMAGSLLKYRSRRCATKRASCWAELGRDGLSISRGPCAKGGACGSCEAAPDLIARKWRKRDRRTTSGYPHRRGAPGFAHGAALGCVSNGCGWSSPGVRRPWRKRPCGGAPPMELFSEFFARMSGMK